MRDPSKYIVDGQRVPSVTEIFHLGGITDLSGIPPEALEKARLRGDRIHSWTELFDKWVQKPRSYHRPGRWKGIEEYCKAYLLFLDETGFVVQDIEKTVVSHEYRYAGQLDRTGYFPDGPINDKLAEPGAGCIGDIKNVFKVRDETALQTAAYQLALGPIKRNRFSLNLKPDGTYQIHHYANNNDYHDWLALVRVVHWKINRGMVEIPGRGK